MRRLAKALRRATLLASVGALLISGCGGRLSVAEVAARDGRASGDDTVDAAIVEPGLDASTAGDSTVGNGEDATSDVTEDRAIGSEAATAGGDALADAGATPQDSGVDASPPQDSGVDAAVDAETLAPCTTAGQSNCVSCPGSTGGICTPTEAVFVRLDIELGIAQAGSVIDPYGCYACVWNNGCIDAQNSVGQECGDLPGSYTAGNAYTGEKSAICLATLECAVGSAGRGCENNLFGVGIVNCFCGDDGTSMPVSAAACAKNGAKANGPCVTQELNGFTYAPSDANDIILNYTDTSGNNPSGIANALVACAVANKCAGCLPP